MMGERFSGVVLRARWAVLAGVVGLMGMANDASADFWKFTYTSDLHGELGHFLVDKTDFTDHIGDPPYASYLDNVHISHLEFAYNGVTWDTSDIDTGDDYTIFQHASTPVPYVSGGHNHLASAAPTQRIFLGGGGAINITGEVLTGEWTTTSTAVPEPASIALVALAMPLITMRRR